MKHRSFPEAVETVLHKLPGTYETTAWPALVLVSGLPGTGKSFLAHRIAERLPMVIVESDRVRKILVSRPTCSGEESIWVHRVAHAAIERLLKAGYRVIYDATNLVEWHRERIYWIARRTGAKLGRVRTICVGKSPRRGPCVDERKLFASVVEQRMVSLRTRSSDRPNGRAGRGRPRTARAAPTKPSP